MSNLVVFAALASIVITAMLTIVLWRMNAPRKGRDVGGDGGVVIQAGGAGRRAQEQEGPADSGGDSGGGGDGGGGD